jgi:hypothetical protein
VLVIVAVKVFVPVTVMVAADTLKLVFVTKPVTVTFCPVTRPWFAAV